MQVGANIVASAADAVFAGILDVAAAVAKNVFALEEVVVAAVVGQDVHESGSGFVQGTVSLELVLKIPMI